MATEASALTLARRQLPPPSRRLASASAKEFAVASSREFEVASGSVFDVATASCNNLPYQLSVEDIVQKEYCTEKDQELFNDVEKFLQEQGSDELATLLDTSSHDFYSNQYPEIHLCPETADNSSLGTVSELGWSQLAKTSTSPDATQSDNGKLDPGVSSNLGWSDLIGEALVCNKNQAKNAVNDIWPLPVENNFEQLLTLVAAEDPSVALVSDHGWPSSVVENTAISPSSTSHQADSNQTVTVTLPVLSAPSLEQAGVQLLNDDSLLFAAFEANISSPSNNKNKMPPEVQVANSPDGPNTYAGKTRPSVIVSTRCRKRALTPPLTHDLTVDDDEDDKNEDGNSQDEVSPAVLEKRRKGNARCKKYRENKKQKEAIEETELERLTRRNEFLKAEEKRLSERKRKLQQSYLSLIRQKKIRFQ